MPKDTEKKVYSPVYQSRISGLLEKIEEKTDAKGRICGTAFVIVNKADGTKGGVLPIRVQHGADLEHFKSLVGKEINAASVGEPGIGKDGKVTLFTRLSQMKAGYLKSGTAIKLSVGAPSAFVFNYVDKKTEAPMVCVSGQLSGRPVEVDGKTVYPDIRVKVFLPKEGLPQEVMDAKAGCLISVNTGVLDLSPLSEGKELLCNAKEVTFLGARQEAAAEAAAEEEDGNSPGM